MTYKFLAHTADIKISALGKTLADAFKSSALALKETILDFEEISIKAKIRKKISITGEDREDLLYKFLEEFIYLIDADNFILAKILKIKINEEKSGFSLTAEVLGDRASSYKFSNKVKAVTFNEMKIQRKKKDFSITFILDV